MILLSSKLIHALPQGTILEPELLSDVLLGSAFHKNGAKRFKLAVVGIGWLGEELLVSGVIHDHAP
jgi:hypothetical protein